MKDFEEKRTEKRLVVDSRVWFSDAKLTETKSPAVMMDINSKAMAFCCDSTSSTPWPGQQLTARFEVPRFGFSDFKSQVTFNRKCKVFRVEDISKSFRKVVVSFERPLFFKPAEQGISETEAKRQLHAINN